MMQEYPSNLYSQSILCICGFRLWLLEICSTIDHRSYRKTLGKCCNMLEIVKKLILTVSSKIVLYSYFCMIDIFY